MGEIVPVGETEDLKASKLALCSNVQDSIDAGFPQDAIQGCAAKYMEFSEAGYKSGAATALLCQAMALSSTVKPKSRWTTAGDVSYAIAQEPGISAQEDALDIGEKALVALREVGDSAGEMDALRALADASVHLTQFSAGVSYAKELVAKCKSDGDPADLAKAQLYLTDICCKAEQPEDGFQATGDAMNYYASTGDKAGQGQCQLCMSELYLLSDSSDEALTAAQKACELYQSADDGIGRAKSLQKQALIYSMGGDNTEALRTAEEAERIYCQEGDTKNLADTLMVIAESKINLREGSKNLATWPPLVKVANSTAKSVKANKPFDFVAQAAACLTQARVLINTNSVKGAWIAAKDAVKNFRKSGKDKKMAEALLVKAKADAKSSWFDAAKDSLNEARAIFDKYGDEAGKDKCGEVEDIVAIAKGLPTRAQMAEIMRKEEERRQQQMQQMMMQQQQMQFMQQQQGMQQPFQMQQFQQEEAPMQQASGGGGLAPREGAPLDKGALVDRSVVQAKVMELAGGIIGDTEDMEMDTPLMEAGLTSNSAVLLRDELSKDIPGVNLPPTLIFDYPSCAAIADFIVEKSAKK